MGASDTHKLSSDEDLKKFLVQKTAHHPDVEYIMEEFVRAEVNSYDAIIDANEMCIRDSHIHKGGLWPSARLRCGHCSLTPDGRRQGQFPYPWR